MPHAVQTLSLLDERRAPSERMVVTDPDHVDRATHDLATGAVVGQSFANLYGITSRADRRSVASVNVMKGRPRGQVGSITTAPSRIPDVWDWTKLPPPRLSRRAVLGRWTRSTTCPADRPARSDGSERAGAAGVRSDAVPGRRQRTGLPVLTAATATTRALLDRLGLRPDVADGGALLRRSP
jgi:hypothetical protein